jgi:hypothetical protein
MPQWFYINSSSPNAQGLSPWAMTLSGSSLEIYYQNIGWWGNLPQTIQLWGIKPDGTIVSATDTSQGLTAGSSNGNGTYPLSLAPITASNPLQIWEIVADPQKPHMGMIVNRETQSAIVTENIALYSTLPIWLQALEKSETIPNNYLWQIRPSIPAANQWNQLCFGKYVLTVDIPTSGLFEPGASVILGSSTPSNTSSAANDATMWMYTNDGFLCNGLNPDLVLSLGPVVNEVQTLVLYPKQSSNSAFQQWNFQQIADSNYEVLLISALQTSQAVTASSDNTVTLAPASSSNPQQQWQLVVGYPVEILLAQPETGFPMAKDQGEKTAYEYISANVNPPAPNGIRAEYTNSAVDKSSYLTQITSDTGIFNAGSAGVSQSDWDATSNQIQAELEACLTVINVFSNWSTLAELVFQTNSLTVSTIADALAVNQNSKASLILGTVAEGMLYTAISAVPGAGGIVANLMQTAYNAMMAANNYNAGTIDGDVAQLQAALIENNTALLKVLGDEQNRVLRNWSMMQEINKMSTLSASHPNSLYWDGDTTNADLLGPLTKGYSLTVAQALLPVQYKIYSYLQQPPSGGGNYTVNWTEPVIGGVVNQYALVNASQSVLNTLWSYGVYPQSFFNGLGGWKNMQTDIQAVNPWGSAQIPCNYLLTEIANNTQSTFQVNVTTNHDDPTTWPHQNDTVTLPPFQSLAFCISIHNHPVTDGCSANVNISDPDQNKISFEIQQDFCGLSAGNIHYNQYSVASQYSVAFNPIAGSYGGNKWGTAQLTINPS